MELKQQASTVQGTAQTVTDSVAGARDVLDRLRVVVAEIDDVSSLTALREVLLGELDAKRRSIEEEDWALLEGLAAKHGHGDVPSWLASRGVVMPSTPSGRVTRRRKRDFSKTPFWRNPYSGAWSVKLGARPHWVKECLAAGYTEDQISAGPGTYEETKGQAYWVDLTTGDYWLNTRPGVPKRIEDLMRANKSLSWAEVTRPPGSFPDENGRVDPSSLPPKITIPEPTGAPETTDE